MSRKQLVWIFAAIALILAIVVLYQQRTIQQSTTTSSIKSVRQQALEQQTINITNTGVVDELSGDVTTGTNTTWSVTAAVIISNQNGCVTSYQALLDRVAWLWEIKESDAGQALSDTVSLWYCNGSTPKESDFLSTTSNGQNISYDSSISGWALKLDSSVVIPDFIKTCTDNCPAVQAVRASRSDNKYVVLETTQSRSYQSSFRLISTTNGVTMLYWSALSYVDPVASYAWSEDGHFVFIGSSGRDTNTYIVQPKSFPKADIIADESDTPIAVSVNGDTITVLYDRNPSNTDLTDRYTKTYTISELNTTTAGSGTVQ